MLFLMLRLPVMLFVYSDFLDLILPSLILLVYCSKQPKQNTTQITLKLLQDITDFSLNLSKTNSILFRMGGAKKPPASFFPLTSTNVGTSPPKVPTLSLTLFSYLCKFSKPYLPLVPNIKLDHQSNPSKKWCLSPFKIKL